MGKYIKLFNTVLEYQAYASDISKFILPNVSLCEDLNKPYINPFTGSKILCKYNVTSTEFTTTLLGNTNNVSSMIVDDAEQEVENSYTFDKTGEHTVLFTLADGVTSIYMNAFKNCSGLTSVTISDSVTSIGAGAFADCSGLTSITIPDSVTSIGAGAFADCSALANIICNTTKAPLISNNTFLNVKTNGALIVPVGSTGYDEWMKKDDYYLGKYGWTKVEQNQVLCKYNVTNTSSPTALRTNYESNVFKSMEIDGVMLDELVTEYTFDTTGVHTVKYELYDETKLGGSAPVFYNSNLIECFIPNTVTSIGSSAFIQCTGLTNITISNSVTSIGSNAFGGTDTLKVLNYNAKCVLSGCFRSSWPNLETVIIGDSTPAIDSAVFSGCRSLTNVTIGNSVTSIGGGAFSSCISLTSIDIPDSVTSIGGGAFSGTGLTSIDIPDSVTSIGGNAFADTGLTSVTIPDSVTSIGGGAFAGCSGLTSINVNSGNTVYDSRNNCNAIIETATNTLVQGCNTTIIPDTVTSIGNSAFSGTGLTSVTIPDTVTSIGNYAFSGCSGLTSIVIPDTVTSIGNYAFQMCSSLTSIVIPNTVTSIGNSAFSGCSGLTSINVNSGNTVYDSRNNCNAIIETATNTLISGCKNTIIPDTVTSIGNRAFYNCTGLTSIDIPDSVTSIGSNAFAGTGLINITIPDSVTSIGDYAFQMCSSLTSIVIPNTVTSIGSSTFSSCTGLINITIPDSVTSIGQDAFSNCSGLTSVTIGSGVTSIGDWTFYSCSSLTSIVSNAMTAPTIANYTFYNIKIGGTLTVPSGSTGYNAWMRTNNYYLGKYSWTIINPVVVKYNVTNTSKPTVLRTNYEQNIFKSMEIDGVMLDELVTEYTFDTTGEHIVKYELYDKTKLGNSKPVFTSGLSNNNLVECIIPDGVTSIGKRAFDNCTGLTSVVIPDSVTSIGQEAFNNCSGLTSIIIPDGVTSIGKSAFYGTSLISVYIPDSVTYISDETFSWCDDLTSINIPNSVTSIGNKAFYHCSSLTSVTIGNGVTNIGTDAFAGCFNIISINVNSGNTVYDSRDNCNAIIKTKTNTLILGCKMAIIPDTVTSIGASAFQSCNGLTSITIPDSVTSMGKSAFGYCNDLTSITIGNSVTSIGASAFIGCGLTSIVSNAMTAPTIQSNTFLYAKTGGTLTVPAGSTGYDAWMSTGDYYLGSYNWTKIEQ